VTFGSANTLIVKKVVAFMVVSEELIRFAGPKLS
jgi:hypothetical protein